MAKVNDDAVVETQTETETASPPTTKKQLDVRGGKIVSAFVLVELQRALSEIQPGEAIDLKIDSFEGLRRDLESWQRLTGHTISPVTTHNEDFHYYTYKVIKNSKATDDSTNKKPSVAILVSRDGLVDLLGPLGFAVVAAACGFDVSIYFMGNGVKVLRRGFKGVLPGLWRPFSCFARKGMADMGHVSVAEKLGQLIEFGAKFYVCHPSMIAMGVKLDQMAYSDEIILAEYATFLEVMKDATVTLYP